MRDVQQRLRLLEATPDSVEELGTCPRDDDRTVLVVEVHDRGVEAPVFETEQLAESLQRKSRGGSEAKRGQRSGNRRDLLIELATTWRVCYIVGPPGPGAPPDAARRVLIDSCRFKIVRTSTPADLLLAFNRILPAIPAGPSFQPVADGTRKPAAPGGAAQEYEPVVLHIPRLCAAFACISQGAVQAGGWAAKKNPVKPHPSLVTSSEADLAAWADRVRAETRNEPFLTVVHHSIDASAGECPGAFGLRELAPLSSRYHGIGAKDSTASPVGVLLAPAGGDLPGKDTVEVYLRHLVKRDLLRDLTATLPRWSPKSAPAEEGELLLGLRAAQDSIVAYWDGVGPPTGLHDDPPWDMFVPGTVAPAELPPCAAPPAVVTRGIVAFVRESARLMMYTLVARGADAVLDPGRLEVHFRCSDTDRPPSVVPGDTLTVAGVPGRSGRGRCFLLAKTLLRQSDESPNLLYGGDCVAPALLPWQRTTTSPTGERTERPTAGPGGDPTQASADCATNSNQAATHTDPTPPAPTIQADSTQLPHPDATQARSGHASSLTQSATPAATTRSQLASSAHSVQPPAAEDPATAIREAKASQPSRHVAFYKPAGICAAAHSVMVASDYPTAVSTVGTLASGPGNDAKARAVFSLDKPWSGVCLASIAPGTGPSAELVAPEVSAVLAVALCSCELMADGVLARLQGAAKAEGEDESISAEISAVFEGGKFCLVAFGFRWAPDEKLKGTSEETFFPRALAKTVAKAYGIVDGTDSGGHSSHRTFTRGYGVRRLMLHVHEVRLSDGTWATCPVPFEFARVVRALSGPRMVRTDRKPEAFDPFSNPARRAEPVVRPCLDPPSFAELTAETLGAFAHTLAAFGGCLPVDHDWLLHPTLRDRLARYEHCLAEALPPPEKRTEAGHTARPAGAAEKNSGCPPSSPGASTDNNDAPPDAVRALPPGAPSAVAAAAAGGAPPSGAELLSLLFSAVPARFAVAGPPSIGQGAAGAGKWVHLRNETDPGLADAFRTRAVLHAGRTLRQAGAAANGLPVPESQKLEPIAASQPAKTAVGSLPVPESQKPEPIAASQPAKTAVGSLPVPESQKLEPIAASQPAKTAAGSLPVPESQKLEPIAASQPAKTAVGSLPVPESQKPEPIAASQPAKTAAGSLPVPESQKLENPATGCLPAPDSQKPEPIANSQLAKTAAGGLPGSDSQQPSPSAATPAGLSAAAAFASSQAVNAFRAWLLAERRCGNSENAVFAALPARGESDGSPADDESGGAWRALFSAFGPFFDANAAEIASAALQPPDEARPQPPAPPRAGSEAAPKKRRGGAGSPSPAVGRRGPGVGRHGWLPERGALVFVCKDSARLSGYAKFELLLTLRRLFGDGVAVKRRAAGVYQAEGIDTERAAAGGLSFGSVCARFAGVVLGAAPAGDGERVLAEVRAADPAGYAAVLACDAANISHECHRTCLLGADSDIFPFVKPSADILRVVAALQRLRDSTPKLADTHAGDEEQRRLRETEYVVAYLGVDETCRPAEQAEPFSMLLRKVPCSGRVAAFQRRCGRFCQAWETKPFLFSGCMDPELAVATVHCALLLLEDGRGGRTSPDGPSGGLRGGVTVLDGCSGSGTLSAAAAYVFGCTAVGSELRQDFADKSRDNFHHVEACFRRARAAGLDPRTSPSSSPTVLNGGAPAGSVDEEDDELDSAPANHRPTVICHDATTPYPEAWTAPGVVDVVVCNPPWGIKFGHGCDALPILSNLSRSFPDALWVFIAPREACDAFLSRPSPRVQKLHLVPYGAVQLLIAKKAV
ncbi:hypothetical protein DIPPA_25061 [Diplonema papillatum]|nr:hypothetical protein DIPPA_25061 [Diplonema papillatum]